MTKKSRRARRQQVPRSPTTTTPAPPKTTQPPPPSLTPDEAEEAVLAAPDPAPRKQVDFAAEYGYVVNDLRSMGIIAIAMLAVLIALSLVVH